MGADAEGASMHRCWLPGSPPSNRSAYVFTNTETADGYRLSSPIRFVEATEANGAVPSIVSNEGDLSEVPFGLGWRWELSSTRHFGKRCARPPFRVRRASPGW